MFSRTLKSKYESYDQALSLSRQILCYSKEPKEIYYNVEQEQPAPETKKEESPSSQAAPVAAAPIAAAAPVAAAPVAASAGPAEQIADAPVKAVDILHAMVAHKLKKSLDEISLSKAIKDLVGGKSTLQNEILGDLQKEFGSTPEKPEDTPLDELGATLQPTHNGQLGKLSSGLITKLISSKMPGGFNLNTARSYLGTRWGLGSGRTDSALVVGLTMEPAARLGAESEAKSFLDEVAQKYAARAGVTLASASAAGAGSGGAGGAVVDSAALDAVTKQQKHLINQQLELFASYLEKDLRSGDKLFIAEKQVTEELRAQLDLWMAEHGEFYASGIEPSFSPLKARVYDSHWNWVRQEALMMYYDIIFGRLSAVDREIVARCISVMNRSTMTVLEFMEFYMNQCPENKGETYKLAKELGTQLIENCKEVMNSSPVAKDVNYPTAPKTSMNEKGIISYAEVPRPSIRKLESYVREMAAGGELTALGTRRQVRNDLVRLYRIIRQQNKMTRSTKLQVESLYGDVMRALENNSKIVRDEKITAKYSLSGQAGDAKHNQPLKNGMRRNTIPFLHLKKKVGQEWEYNQKLTSIYIECLETAAKDGVTFSDKNVLITGAGAGSIGAEILQGLLQGGARVIVTTSRYSKEVTEFYQSLYTTHGAKGSCLIVVPFNQGSKQDVEALVEYIYDVKSGLGSFCCHSGKRTHT